MLKNYFKIALRSLLKNRLYSILNVAGLSVGFAAALIISFWVISELEFNTYNQNYDRLGLIQKNLIYNGSVNTTESNSILLGATLRNEYGQYFDEVVVSSFGGEQSLKYKEASAIKRGYFMEKGGHKILDLQIIKGSPTFPLDPTSILISEKTASALFGTENPVSKIINLSSKANLKVVGVYKNFPLNSTFRNVDFYADFEAFANMEEWVRNSKTRWEEQSFPIYIKLARNTDFDVVSKTIAKILLPHTDDKSQPEVFIHPMSKWRLYPAFENGKAVGSGLNNILIFAGIGILILLLAIINFVNLVTARASIKAKEIGVRKAIGSSRKGILQMIYAEVALLVFIAGIISLFLVQLFAGWFNTLTAIKIEFNLIDTTFILKFFSALAIITLLAGIYPALYLSSFNPIKILKGLRIGSGKEVLLRKTLVVFQFTISVMMLVSMLVISQQLKYGMNRPMGYDKNRLIQIQKNTPGLRGHFWAMREQLLASGAVKEMAEMNTPLAENWHNQSGISWRGKPENSSDSFGEVIVTPEFGKTVNWKISQGRDFDRKFKTDTASVILNKSAAELIGFKNPLNEYIEFSGNRYAIVGIAKDIIFDSPYDNAKPTIFFMRLANAPFITLKLTENLSVNEAVSRIEKIVKRFDPEATLNIKFADYELESKFWREKRSLEMISIFSFTAIFICCLGLFGLATFTAERRTKEIGIRKVLGASVIGITGLLSKDFLKLVLIGIVIAGPIAYYFMNQWLQGFVYRIDIEWWIFAAAGGLSILIAFITVGYQSIKAALMNPVKSLKTE
ncbi:ABC transporter permease [Emticicia sp. BO119]|uniref:ABC transporter permease n=1 Tax=Emticicia sp. BO119 TaxID=2757768 RepID=UPI0015F0A2E2|nr:ABC transporter permease [Emticicia sp. BO119]MBA4850051.1 ABC transporter permease [Emticicia sp. BO119]